MNKLKLKAQNYEISVCVNESHVDALVHIARHPALEFEFQNGSNLRNCILHKISLEFNPFNLADQHRYLCSVDLDETARNEPSHQDIHCCHSGLDFRLKPLFVSVGLSKPKDG